MSSKRLILYFFRYLLFLLLTAYPLTQHEKDHVSKEKKNTGMLLVLLILAGKFYYTFI